MELFTEKLFLLKRTGSPLATSLSDVSGTAKRNLKCSIQINTTNPTCPRLVPNYSDLACLRNEVC